MEEFSQEQQIVIDKLIKQKYNEAYTKAKAEATDTIAAAELKYNEELTTLRGKVETLQNLSGETTKRLRQALLKSEIALLQPVSVDQIAKLIDESIVIDDQQNLNVIDAEGNKRFTTEGSPLSAKLFIEEFLASNPHLKLASRSAGSGGGRPEYTPGPTKTMKRAEFDILPDSKKTRFIHSGGTLT